MEEGTISDASTIGGIPPMQSAAAVVKAEGTINDAKTLVDLPGQNPAGQKGKELNEPVLAEIDQFALIKKLGEGAAG